MSLQKGFFKVQSSNPILPPEEWTLVYENITPGAYSTTLDWGKYKFEVSGGGGSGGSAAIGQYPALGLWAANGTAGELITGAFSVGFDNTATITGSVGGGGGASYSRAARTGAGPYAISGTGGVGAQNGTRGAYDWYTVGSDSNKYALAAGSGGGSTSLDVNGEDQWVARGGNGGDCNMQATGIRYGGAGGGGGISGSGASGGAGITTVNGEVYSGAGTNGYVRIYKSNLKPEPL